MTFCSISSVILAPRDLTARQSLPPREFTIVVYSPQGKDYLNNVSENHGHSGWDYTNCVQGHTDILYLNPQNVPPYIYYPFSMEAFHFSSGIVWSTLHLSGGTLVWRQTLPQEEQAFAPSACSGHHISQVIQQSIGLPEELASLAAMSDRPSSMFSGVLCAHLETTYYVACCGA